MSFINNFSPEEILRKKELESGFEYDGIPEETPTPTPTQDQIQEIPHVEPEIKVSVKQPEPFETIIPNPPDVSSVTQNSLGKSQKLTSDPAGNIGWKNIPVTILPSSGMFYPEGTKIAIRAAEVKEIRHYSTIDDDDKLDIEEKLSYVIERCTRMEFPYDGVMSYKDLKQEDRFFIIMAIRDLTFIKGENMIKLNPYKKCKSTPDCPFESGIELRTGVLSSYDIDAEILEYYDSSSRSFVFNPKKINKKIEISIPSIGVTQEISNFIREASIKNIEVDDGFISIAPFLFSDWRSLSFQTILGKMREIDNFWSKEEYSLYYELSERVKMGTKLEVELQCPNCGEEVAAKITFPRGLRSLFLISDIFRELF
jgi:hypothetical protein